VEVAITGVLGTVEFWFAGKVELVASGSSMVVSMTEEAPYPTETVLVRVTSEATTVEADGARVGEIAVTVTAVD
jgi:hypothetical protein